MAARDEILRLRELGVSQRSIGQAIGRNDSLISQIARGRKPGANLADRLAELRQRVEQGTTAGLEPRQAARAAAVPEPARRQTRAGTPARVRRPVTVRGDSWAASQTKRQATRAGAHGMAHPLSEAAQHGRQVAATVSVDRGLSVNSTSGGRKGRLGAGGHFTINLGDAGQVAAEVRSQHGGNFTEYVMAQALEAGYLSGADDSREAAQHAESIELRAF